MPVKIAVVGIVGLLLACTSQPGPSESASAEPSPSRVVSASPSSAVTPSPTPPLTPTIAPADGPLLVVAGIQREPRSRVIVRVVQPRAGSDELAVVDEVRLRLRRVDLDVAHTQIEISPNGDILIWVRGHAAWLWRPGTDPTAALQVPKEMETSSELKWSPDGELLVSLPWYQDDHLTIWSPRNGSVRRVASAAAADYQGVAGWFPFGIVVYRMPTIEFSCDWHDWMATVDASTGAVVPYAANHPVGTSGSVAGDIAIGVASGEGAWIADGKVQLASNCAEGMSGRLLELPTQALPSHVQWSLDGSRLYVLATVNDERVALTYEYGADGWLALATVVPVPRVAGTVSTVDDSGRWLVLGTGNFTCSTYLVLDIAAAVEWLADECVRTVQRWLPD